MKQAVSVVGAKDRMRVTNKILLHNQVICCVFLSEIDCLFILIDKNIAGALIRAHLESGCPMVITLSVGLSSVCDKDSFCLPTNLFPNYNCLD